ncbi:MAG: hypothetical protein L3K18_09485 [Thermoplasmata archaeon]|nr:hypothetical protein [Thermoplasmata archaeon]
MSGFPAPPPPTIENIESAVVTVVSLAKLVLGETKTREIISRAMGDPPKVVMGP